MHLFLLYDPDRDSRSILGVYLRHLGHQVLDTDLPEDALALARQHRPDVVVSEFVAPFSSSPSLLESLRREAATAGIPVVVWTSRVSPEALRRIEASRGVFVPKPAAPRTVYQAAIRVLGEPRADAPASSDDESRPSAPAG